MASLPSQKKRTRRFLPSFFLLVTLSISLACAQGLSSTPDSPRAANANPLSASVKVEIAQRLLGRLGLLNEIATGQMTTATADALRRFAVQQNLPADGQINDQLLRAMRSLAWNKGGWSKGDIKGKDKLVDKAGVREAQSYLSKLGYEPGPLDATFGPQTQSSVEAFQASQKTSVDGLVTDTTLMNLKRATILPSAEVRGTVRILNFPDYIDPAVLEEFERETKIKVIYDTGSSDEEIESKLKTATEPFDVAILTATTILNNVANGLLRPLDKKSLKNLANLDPKILAYSEAWDPGAKYSVPYMWFTVGIASNLRLAAKFAPNASLDSLKSIFDPEQARKFAACGIKVVDSASDIIPLAGLYGGLKKWTNDAQSIAIARKVLMAVKNIVQPISDDEIIPALAKGKICIALGFSGDSLQARKEADPGNDIQYRIPVEGSSLAFDSLTVTSNSKHVDQAHSFIDFVLRPKVIGKISNFVRYPNGNLNSRPFIDPAMLSDPAVYPPAEVMQRLIVVPSINSNTKLEMQRLWKEFSGK